MDTDTPVCRWNLKTRLCRRPRAAPAVVFSARVRNYRLQLLELRRSDADIESVIAALTRSAEWQDGNVSPPPSR